MFNQAGFNQLPFNREFALDVFGAFMLDHSGDVLVTGNIVAQEGFDIEHEIETVFDAIRGRLAEFVFEHVDEVLFDATRERYGGFQLSGTLAMEWEAGRYRVEVLEFSGTFAPGDRIVIDSKWLTFTKNGVNALQDMDGDFFDLNLGPNVITYTDDQTGRSVRMRITHRDKFV